ncbi:MAG: hypothetical protein MJA83_18605 [Gammaproteobacteria bacterium]|nr:hypothetical protein [Gammaproteobacteria bacterium]
MNEDTGFRVARLFMALLASALLTSVLFFITWLVFGRPPLAGALVTWVVFAAAIAFSKLPKI